MKRKGERRRCRRFDLSWPIEVTSGDRGRTRGRTSNISRGGAFFRSPSSSSIETGMIVEVSIDVPSAAGGAPPPAIVGRARVVRLEESPDGFGVALHFSEELDALPGAET